MHILHLINPYSSGSGTFDSRMQSLTMESMVEAKRFAKKDVQISLCYTCLEGDIVAVPSEFIQLSSLTRSIVNVHVDLNGKKLPSFKIF